MRNYVGVFEYSGPDVQSMPRAERMSVDERCDTQRDDKRAVAVAPEQHLNIKVILTHRNGRGHSCRNASALLY